ncbi:MAG: DUF483 domain-containing protein [Peptococcaceae bacterium]|nr:DUF483 domain-containing protein [Peptococcaceae bacterium]
MTSLKHLLQNDVVPMRVRTEAIALVALGVRPMSIVFLPAELPEGNLLGREIDSTYQCWLQEGSSGTLSQRYFFWLQSRGKTTIEHKKSLLRKAYENIVPPQASYKALLGIVQELSLPYIQYEVRPSIRELYICASDAVKERLDQLMQERETIKREAWAKVTSSTPYSLLAYPEEQVPEYLKKLGELLGYPPCCIEAYLTDRTQGQNVENRSAYFLLEFEQMNEAVNPLGFFLKDFFPCRPNCEQALSKGQECYDRLGEVDKNYAEAYLQSVNENKNRVTKYPAIISAHLDSLNK